jgi:hypothetical protein
MTESEIEAARNETAEGISGCLRRLSTASKLLTLQQRMLLAEGARDLADSFDRGLVLSPGDNPRRRRFVKTEHVDENGAPLFREVAT